MHPLIRNLGLTGLASLITALSAMVVISLAGRFFGPVLLGEYLLVRRMASWLQAAVVLPSGIALPRYVAASIREPRSTRQTYFLGAVLAGCGVALVLIVAFSCWKVPLSRWIFGNTEMKLLVVPLGVLLLGLAAHGACFGYYQGTLSMGRACGAQLLNLAIFPLLTVVILSGPHSIPLIVEATGIAMTACAFFYSIPIFTGFKVRPVLAQAYHRTRELLSFGLSRTWGDFGLQALLSLPAVIAAHFLPMRSVTFLLLGGSFLALVAAATLPLGVILLSQVTRSLAEGRMAQLRQQLVYFIDALVGSSLFVCLQVFVFADSILQIWVGPNFASATRVVQILVAGIPFYFVYSGLRSIVDAAAIEAHNTRNILIALGFFVAEIALLSVGALRGWMLEGLAVAVVISMALLCGLTLRTIQKLFAFRIHWIQLAQSVGLAVVFGGCSFALHAVFGIRFGFVSLLSYELLAAIVFFSALWMIRSPWLRFFAATVLVMKPPLSIVGH